MRNAKTPRAKVSFAFNSDSFNRPGCGAVLYIQLKTALISL